MKIKKKDVRKKLKEIGVKDNLAPGVVVPIFVYQSTKAKLKILCKVWDMKEQDIMSILVSSELKGLYKLVPKLKEKE